MMRDPPPGPSAGRRRVFMITPFAPPNIGGVESQIEKFMELLPSRGYPLLLATYQPLTTPVHGKTVERREGVDIYRIPWFGHGWFPKVEPYFPFVFLWLFPGLFLGSLWLYVRNRRTIGVIHAQGFVAAAIAKILTALSPVRVVVSTHAVYHLTKRRLLRVLVRWLLGSADSILCVGTPSMRELAAIGLDPSRIQFRPNWINLEHFRPLDRDTCRRDLRFERCTVLFAGRLLVKKGIHILLEIAPRFPEIQFVFLGDGPEASALRVAAAEHHNIDFRGRVSDEDLVRHYTAADVFVQLALYEEGSATVFLESIACGTPIIGSVRGCAGDYLDPAVSTLIEPTVSELRCVLQRFLDHPEELTGMRARCRPFAEEHYSERNVEVITQSYAPPSIRGHAVLTPHHTLR